jgi:hypothetical protein
LHLLPLGKRDLEEPFGYNDSGISHHYLNTELQISYGLYVCSGRRGRRGKGYVQLGERLDGSVHQMLDLVLLADVGDDILCTASYTAFFPGSEL